MRRHDRSLQAWKNDPAVELVLIDHSGERGFCAGGDIRMLAESGAADGAKAREFFHTEYRLNHLREEIFGPVLVVQRIEDVDDLAQLANDSEYGLAASICSNDLKAVHRLAPKIRAGTVWVNCHNLLDASLPFGGYK